MYYLKKEFVFFYSAAHHIQKAEKQMHSKNS